MRDQRDLLEPRHVNPDDEGAVVTHGPDRANDTDLRLCSALRGEGRDAERLEIDARIHARDNGGRVRLSLDRQFVDVQALLKRRVGLEECVEPGFALGCHDRPLPVSIGVLTVACPRQRGRRFAPLRPCLQFSIEIQ